MKKAVAVTRSRKVLMLFFGLAVIATLAGCSNAIPGEPPNDGPSGLEVTGNAKGWGGGEAFVKATATSRENNEVISQGSLNANGDFAMLLPDDPYLERFGPLTCDATETGTLSTSPNSLRVVLVRSFGVTPTDKLTDDELGEVVYAKGDLQGTEGATIGSYAYASAAGTVRGTCRYGDQVTVSTFDLTLEPGWNPVTTVFEFQANGQYVTTYRTGKLPTDLRWVYAAYPPPINDGPSEP